MPARLGCQCLDTLRQRRLIVKPPQFKRPSDTLPSPTTGRQLAYCLAIPGAALCLFGALALLWASAYQPLYFHILLGFGVEGFRLPFLDIHAVLAAAECHRHGVDVYVTNPCDVVGRLDGYSPLWLSIVPGSWGARDTLWVGTLLDVLFILSLPIVLRPRSTVQILLFAVAAFSPMTVFALERANIDIIIFLLVLCAAALYAAPRAYRLCSYAVILAAGLLKFYPVVLLALMARERWHRFLLPAIIAAALLLAFGLYAQADLGRALANIPPVPYFTNGFSATSLPYGLTEHIADRPYLSHDLIGVALLSALVAMAAARTWRNLRFLGTTAIDWTEWEMILLAIGCLLLTACFFAAPNVDYRGIFFLLVLPGLVRLRRTADDAVVKHWLSWMIAATLFLMWKEFFRRSLYALLDFVPNERTHELVEAAFWLGREFIWWWLITGLAALALLQFWSLPLTKDGIAGFRRLRRLSANPS
jgi:hypothetical protein